MNKISSLLKAAAAAVVVVALLVGLPLALVWFNGWPLDDIVAIFNDPLMSDNDRITAGVEQVAGLIGWVVWLQFLVALPQEVVAYRAGRETDSVMVAPLFQRLLRRLVESMFLLGSIFGSALPAAASPALPQATVEPVYAEEQPADSIDVETKTVKIEKTDTLLSFAERELGDADRWEEIVALNNDRTMVDGTVFGEDTRFLEIGWELIVPDDQPKPSGPVDTVVVERGDNQWDIAKSLVADRLGREPTNEEIHPVWEQLTEANEANLLPPGDPNLIYPNQKLEIPDTAQTAEPETQPKTEDNKPAAETTPTPDVEAEEAPKEVEPVGDETESEPVADEPAADVDPVNNENSSTSESDEDANPAEKTSPIGQVEGDRPEATPVPVTETATKDSAQVIGDEVEVNLDERKVGALGLVLAGAASVAVMHRRRKRANRKPGMRPWPKNRPRPDTAQAGVEDDDDKDFFGPGPDMGDWVGEPSILAHSDPTLSNDLNVALRTLSAYVCDDETSTGTPDLVAATVDAEEIIFLFDSPQSNPPEPFRFGDKTVETFWTLDRSEQLPDVDSVALFPTLVSIGTELAKEAVFAVDLEASGVVNVSADRSQDVVDTMATWALELAVSPLADGDLEIFCVGFGQELESLDNVTYVDDLDEIKDRVEGHVSRIEQAASDHGIQAAQGRAVGGDVWSPFVVLDPFVDGDKLDELVALARTTSGSGLTVVASGVDAEKTEWSLHLGETEPDATIKATLSYGHDPIGYVRYRQNTTVEQRTEIVAEIDDARNPSYIPQPVLYDELTTKGPDVAVPDVVVPNFVQMPVINRNQKPPMPDPVHATGNGDLDAADDDGLVVDLDLNTVSIPDLPEQDDVVLPPWEPSAVVKVLGSLRVETSDGQPIEFGPSQSAGLVAYLTLHRKGISTDQAIEAMVPNKDHYKRDIPSRRRSLNNIVSGTRAALAAVLGVERPEVIPYRAASKSDESNKPIVISDLVESDHERFQELIDFAMTRPLRQKIGALRAALELVEGRPFGGYVARWHEAEAIEGDLLIKIEETALALARLYLEDLATADPDGAEWALKQGLTAYPESAQLWIKRFETAVAKDPNGERPELIWTMYEKATTDPQDGFEPNPDMADLYMRWRESRTSKSNKTKSKRALTAVNAGNKSAFNLPDPAEGFDAWLASEAHG